MPKTTDPIHTREDLANYETASELAFELVGRELIRMALEGIKDPHRSRILGIITACVAFQTSQVREYVETHS